MENSNYELLPKRVTVLTCGVDVLDDRLEGEVKAWDRRGSCWGIEPFVIKGDIAGKEVWKELDEIIDKIYLEEKGLRLKVCCTCIDSGGHFTEEVYRFCKDREEKSVYALKGSSRVDCPIVSESTILNRYGLKLFIVGTNRAKELIFKQLKGGKMHFNGLYGDEYFEQLYSEKEFSTVWRPMQAQSQALDYTIYNFAAYTILNKFMF